MAKSEERKLVPQLKVTSESSLSGHNRATLPKAERTRSFQAAARSLQTYLLEYSTRSQMAPKVDSSTTFKAHHLGKSPVILSPNKP